jgi:hypothetical protein
MMMNGLANFKSVDSLRVFILRTHLYPIRTNTGPLPSNSLQLFFSIFFKVSRIRGKHDSTLCNQIDLKVPLNKSYQIITSLFPFPCIGLSVYCALTQTIKLCSVPENFVIKLRSVTEKFHN